MEINSKLVDKFSFKQFRFDCLSQAVKLALCEAFIIVFVSRDTKRPEKR